MKKHSNQGEGDRVSARHYNRRVHEFVATGKVDEAAREAEQFVEKEPEEAARAERAGKRGPRSRVSIDEIVAKGRTVIDRVRPMVERVATKIRSRLSK
ncbi:MAG: hypothetical protein ABI867_24945 [Kofleriaceae bacterium]